jgi:hypothetical protein
MVKMQDFVVKELIVTLSNVSYIRIIYLNYNKYTREKDAKNIAEIQTTWTKTTWKTFEETLD